MESCVRLSGQVQEAQIELKGTRVGFQSGSQDSGCL